MNINLKIKRLFIKHEVSERKSYFKQYFMITMETVMNKCFLFFRYCTAHAFLTGGCRKKRGPCWSSTHWMQS